jgi:membrane protein
VDGISLVETIRDILRRAYGTQWEHAFWRYRLMSTGLIIASVVLILVSIWRKWRSARRRK